jgi:hypothetical protein
MIYYNYILKFMMMKKQEVCESVMYVKPTVEMFELEIEESVLLAASTKTVRFNAGNSEANGVSGARDAGKLNL